MASHINMDWRKRNVTLRNGIKIGSRPGITTLPRSTNPVTLLAPWASHRYSALSSLPIAQAGDSETREFFPWQIRHVHIQNGARPQNKRTFAFKEHAHDSGGCVVMITPLTNQRDRNSRQTEMTAFSSGSHGT